MLHPASATEVVVKRPVSSPVPVVADANVLIKDTCANLRRIRETALLGLARAGRIRLLVTDRVAHEVPTRMHRVAGSSLHEAVKLWNSSYAPLVSVVDVSRCEPEPAIDALLAGVRRDDPDDVPTAYLALLCAPCAVVSEDADLLDHGFGAPEWLSGLRASGQLGDLDLGLHYGAGLSGALIENSATRLYRLARGAVASPIAAGAILALVVFLSTDARPWTAARWRQARLAVLQAMEAAERLGEEVGRLRGELLGALEPLTVPPMPEPPPASQLARHLACAADPVPAAVLANAIGAQARDVTAILREHPAFTVVRGRGWRLGREAAVAAQ